MVQNCTNPQKLPFELFRVALKRGETPCGSKKLQKDNVDINITSDSNKT